MSQFKYRIEEESGCSAFHYVVYSSTSTEAISVWMTMKAAENEVQRLEGLQTI